MLRTTRRIAGIFVLVHLLLGGALLATDAIHGINDQDASFAVLLVVHYLNLPTIWLFKWFGLSVRSEFVILAGIFQWIVLAFVLAAAYHGVRTAVRAIAGGTAQTGEQVEHD